MKYNKIIVTAPLEFWNILQFATAILSYLVAISAVRKGETYKLKTKCFIVENNKNHKSKNEVESIKNK